MSPFDVLRDTSFDTVANTMGDLATWGDETAKVLYKDETESENISGNTYNPYKFSMEWRKPFLPGLKESVDINTVETVTINIKGTDTDFYVRRVDTLFDGSNYKAYLEKVPGG